MLRISFVYKLINYYTQHFLFPHRGWKYFHRWLQWWGIEKKEYRKKLKDNLFMRVTPSEHIQRQLFWYGYYERPLVRLLQKVIRADSIVIDIGANIGYFTLVAAQKAKNGKVIAFEPVKELFQKLQNNIHENHLNNIEIIQAAVGETQRTSRIYLSTADNAGMSSTSPPENFSGFSQAVEMISIDHWVQQSGLKKIDIIKLDIEGSELFALQGMKQSLLSLKPMLIVEINPETLAYFNLENESIFNYLTAIRYWPFCITENGYLQKAGDRPEGNVVFIHQDRTDEFSLYFYTHQIWER